jgi:hypothetical protein
MNRWLVLGLLLAGGAALLIGLGSGDDDVTPSSDHRGAESRSVPAHGATAATSLPVPIRTGRIVGYVRDVNGRPVKRARVSLGGSARSVRASRSGRYVLRAPTGTRAVTAVRSGYTPQRVTTRLRRGRGHRVDFSLAVTATDRIEPANSADTLLIWTSCQALAQLDEAGLQRWIDRGADGFVCQSRHLPGLGGSQRFSARPSARPAGADTKLQDELVKSAAVRLAKEGKLRLYLAFYALNYYNTRTPFEEWFDDRGWSQKVLPAVRNLAAAAREMGFTGLGIDQELYPQKGGATTASWSARYPGSSHDEAAVRAKVRQRGRELAAAMLSGFPGFELVAYDTLLPESWYVKVQADVNHQPDVLRDDVRVNLWDGISSVEGYSAIRLLDALFYKTYHLSGATWDTALQYNANRVYSYLSRHFSNWSYASSRLHLTPFAWIDSGSTPFERARTPQEVAAQLDAFARWGIGGSFANYAYQGLGTVFDYGPYEAAMRRASTPARVDQQPPSLELTVPATPRVPAGKTIDLRGSANDDFAIRAVRWSDDHGRQGVAKMTWTYAGDMRSGWKGVTHWQIDGLTVAPNAGHLTITAEDIHGLARDLRLSVVG